MIQYQIFSLKDKDNNDKKYTFHMIDKKYYFLRYTDRNCMVQQNTIQYLL